MTDNERIARFMGAITVVGYGITFPVGAITNRRQRTYNAEELRFEQSWDWIIPAWIRFRDLDFPKNSDLELKHTAWVTSLQWYLFSSNEPKRFTERMAYAIKWFETREE